MTDFVRVSDMSEATLLRDYSFLMKLQRVAQQQNNEAKHSSAEVVDQGLKRKRQRKRKTKLASACDHRGIKLQELPAEFSRKKQNRSRLVDGRLIWTVEVDADGDKHVVHKISEDQTVASVLEAAGCNANDWDFVLLPIPGRPANDPKFVQIKPDQALKDCLGRGLPIIEFPTIVLRRVIETGQLAESIEAAVKVESGQHKVARVAFDMPGKDAVEMLPEGDGKDQVVDDEEAEELSPSASSSSSSSSSASSSDDENPSSSSALSDSSSSGDDEDGGVMFQHKGTSANGKKVTASTLW